MCVEEAGDIYVAEWGGHRLQRWSPGATSDVTIAGIAGVSCLTADCLTHPSYVALSADENVLYVADQGNHRVQRRELI
jgi:sugar lactone lactonase YvrE